MSGRYAAVVGSGLALWCTAWGAPVLEVKPAVFDWGRQTENKAEYAFTFTVKNTGDEELRIDKVRPACSCTKVELKKQNLAPGESTELTGTLTTKGTQGIMRKSIHLTSNDPAHPTSLASLAIRFPFNGQGLRIQGGAPTAVRLRDEGLWAFVTVENCEPETAAKIEALELPAGWESPQKFPATIAAEDRFSFILKRPVEAGAEPQAFDGLTYTLVTDSVKTPRLQNTLTYRPAPPPAAPKVSVTPPAAPAAAAPAPAAAAALQAGAPAVQPAPTPAATPAAAAKPAP